MSVQGEGSKGDVSKTDTAKEVNLNDDLLSKLEVVLVLSRKILYGLFVFWAIVTILGVAAGIVGSITIGENTVINVNGDIAMQVSTMVFPIISSLVTLLLGTIIGRYQQQMRQIPG